MINYYLLTKPGIVLGNLVTFAAGFLLASKGVFDLWLFSVTLLGLALTMASACVFNNYIDRYIDKKMQRTKDRALANGLISYRNALLFAAILGLTGMLLLWFTTNLVTTFVAAAGFFVYVVLYSLWKCRTIYGTAIGSIAGAVPPVVGYCAVSHQLDAGALILFVMMVLWQMPHFFAIALAHYDDYAAAEIPVLPIMRGMLRTKIHMVLYIFGFIVASLLLTLFHYTGYVYLAVTMVTGLLWLGFCVTGFSCANDQRWGRDMFRVSLAIIASVCFVIPFDVV
jgi:protoheme IX farnesyltransferase